MTLHDMLSVPKSRFPFSSSHSKNVSSILANVKGNKRGKGEDSTSLFQNILALIPKPVVTPGHGL